MLSIIIPIYKDPLSKPTIQSLLDNAESDIEVIAVLDGCWLDNKDIVSDNRVRYLHLGKSRGMRDAINAGVDISRGEYLMRTDSHCMFGKGYDVILTKDLQDNWIITPRRYFLDPDKWEVMNIPPIDDMKLKIVNYDRGQKFSGVDWNRPNLEPIHETMAMQGSCWIMKRSWWDKVIGKLQSEGYGTHYQDSHEMVFKTWKAGGKLMVNTNTWHAHKHRKFPRTHGYGGKDADDCFKYSLSVWKDYYNEIKPKWEI